MKQQLATRTDLCKETITLALKYLRKQYQPLNRFEDLTVGYVGKFSNHDGNFYQIVYLNHN